MLVSPSSSCGWWWPLMSLGRSRCRVLDILRPPDSDKSGSRLSTAGYQDMADRKYLKVLITP
jgi:hypothetical protein